MAKRYVSLPLIQKINYMFKWNKDTIKWFSISSKESQFHKELALIIKDILTLNATVLDIGAGLGFLDRELIKYCKSITLVEPDKIAFNYLCDNLMPNMELINNKWEDYKLQSNKKYDHILLSFFSRMDREDNLDELLKICKKSIIYIRNENHDSNDNLINYLNSKNADYKYTQYELDFSQPLEKEEINKFFETYYQHKNKKELLKKLLKSNDKYLYKNNKRISIFVIKNKNNEEKK